PDRVRIRRIRSGKTIGEVALGPFMRERFGAPYWVVHRADLQTILLDAVRSRPSIRLVMGRTVEASDNGADAVSLTLATESGTREGLRADAVIGADGVWSKTRATLDERAAPSFRGAVAWRAAVERNRVPSVFRSNEIGLWLGQRGHVVHYPIAEG
ncbi:FAD-binding monooxygenase, partial [Corallococcus exiguus]|uniref:FAD-dependent monooxygenase n=1 Tax=Corallococcus exiguus TaxID=83462 RepID=UPI0014733989